MVGRNTTVIAANAGWVAILDDELHFGNVNVEKFHIFMLSFEEILGIAHVVVVIDDVPMFRVACESFSDLNINFLLTYLNFCIPI